MAADDPPSLLRSAVDTLPINLAILDADGTIVYTNQSWKQFGTENEIDLRPDTIGVNYLEVAGKDTSETGRRAIDGLREILAGERDVFELEYPCHSPSVERWFLMRATSFRHDGERYVSVAHSDITDRYESERELERSNERLEQFAHAASHDLQEPLRMVTSYLDMLERRYGAELDEEAIEFIEFATDGASRMKAMIDGLLEYSRVETATSPSKSVDLDAVLSDVRTDLGRRIEETDAEITTESLPIVRGDPSQLRQVFQNLLDNAIEYSGETPPRVDVSATRLDGMWRLSVSDDGIGIDPANEDRIFGVFERLHTHEEHTGSGIGLALVNRIVERHGGDIWVESEQGAGSTFSFTLPPATDEADGTEAG
ncbi:PAS domain-containing sensor histidine kinase [Halovivax gelatinilyticus]|uniref:PAS domain-containing sensor histidine kinase n=1 Tax=Halovivax gelatinilyticus TaxID=2961597 RepID=UPI0020CA9523|nr:ATP-binding protein [Halovivax gelatinilyticus]